MANSGPHDNGSQFFFTLGRADELNNKHTIFGKITGDTIYNMLRLSEVEIDMDERPTNPYKITSTEGQQKLKNEKLVEEVDKAKSKGTKNFSLLSFGEEAEEEEVEVNRVSQSMKGKSKSSHDLLKDDPHLSSIPAIESEKANESDNSDEEEEDGYCDEDDGLDNEEKYQMKKRIMQKLKKNTDVPVKKVTEGEQMQKKSSRSEELRKEVRQLKRELIKAKQKKEENPSKVKENQFEEEAAPNSIVAEYLEEKKKYEQLRKQQPKKGTSREDQTLALLDRFKSKLNQAIAETPENENEVPEPEVENDEGWTLQCFHSTSRKPFGARRATDIASCLQHLTSAQPFPRIIRLPSTADTQFQEKARLLQGVSDRMSHVLHFEDKTRKVKDASVPDEDTFEIYDPRNPVNKRRREESKKILREKKTRR